MYLYIKVYIWTYEQIIYIVYNTRVIIKLVHMRDMEKKN